jgi:hypothetical protein
LEKTPVNIHRYVDFAEHFRPFVLLAGLFLLAEWVLRVRRYPLYV